MGIFDLFKKKHSKKNSVEAQTHLTPEGDLPLGWLGANKDFTSKINTNFSNLLHKWIESTNKSPKEKYTALKSFVSYIESTKEVCTSKGECFEFWFNEIIASPDYLEKRKEELCNLEANLDELQQEYEKKQELLININEKVIEKLQDDVTPKS